LSFLIGVHLRLKKQVDRMPALCIFAFRVADALLILQINYLPNAFQIHLKTGSDNLEKLPAGPNTVSAHRQFMTAN
jgi:hypothetical protein